MTTRRYFYNFTANKIDKSGAYPVTVYDRFQHGTFGSDDKNDDVYQHVLDIANEAYPDADNINITALNLI